MRTSSAILRLSACVPLFLGSYSNFAKAGNGAGSSGGGKAVVCRAGDESISKAYLLDLYEAAARWRLAIKPPAGDLTSEFARYLMELRRQVGDPRPFGPTEDKNLAEKIQRLRFMLDPVPVTDDLGTTIPLPPNCKVEQAIFFSDDTLEGLTDPWIWEAMDDQNRAALLAHEEIYYGFRKAGELTAETTRRTVAELFSTTPPPAVWSEASGLTPSGASS